MRPLPLNYPAVGTKLFIRPWLWPRHLLREAIDTRLRLGRPVPLLLLAPKVFTTRRRQRRFYRLRHRR